MHGIARRTKGQAKRSGWQKIIFFSLDKNEWRTVAAAALLNHKIQITPAAASSKATVVKKRQIHCVYNVKSLERKRHN